MITRQKIFRGDLLIRASLLLCMLTWHFNASAQEPDPQTEAESSSLTSPDVSEAEFSDEITVVGEKSLIALRYQIRQAEENLYDMFNELNTHEEFKITCRSTRHTRSHIPVRNCEPRFLKDLRQSNSRSAILEMRQAVSDPENGQSISVLNRGLDLLESEPELKQQLQDEFEELSLEMLRIALENPQYRQELLRIEQLKTEYSNARQSRFGSRNSNSDRRENN